ncbi:MAG: DUF177 domain-containing protein [Lactobacillales bacterium]|jgi:uncharacterized metal-binding protein YceD (DUF177 family)|nr:DUF177 domain-containing protein [Lactobacillales bacterium]
MEKSVETQNGVNKLIDARQITPSGMRLNLIATPDERKELAAQFDVPAIDSLSAEVDLSGTDPYLVTGKIRADLKRKSVVSLEVFDQKMAADFRIVYSKEGIDTQSEQDFDIDMDEEDVEIVKNGKINLKELIFEQFGLNLDPFPKKEEGYFEYIEEMSAEEKKAVNPFSSLKKLIK